MHDGDSNLVQQSLSHVFLLFDANAGERLALRIDFIYILQLCIKLSACIASGKKSHQITKVNNKFSLLCKFVRLFLFEQAGELNERLELRVLAYCAFEDPQEQRLKSHAHIFQRNIIFMSRDR